MAKYNFDTYDLTSDSMHALERQLEIADKLLKSQRDNPRLDTEYKEILSTLVQSLIKTEDILDTLIAEVDHIKQPWYKKLFRK